MHCVSVHASSISPICEWPEACTTDVFPFISPSTWHKSCRPFPTLTWSSWSSSSANLILCQFFQGKGVASFRSSFLAVQAEGICRVKPFAYLSMCCCFWQNYFLIRNDITQSSRSSPGIKMSNWIKAEISLWELHWGVPGLPRTYRLASNIYALLTRLPITTKTLSPCAFVSCTISKFKT